MKRFSKLESLIQIYGKTKKLLSENHYLGSLTGQRICSPRRACEQPAERKLSIIMFHLMMRHQLSASMRQEEYLLVNLTKTHGGMVPLANTAIISQRTIPGT